MLTIEKSEVLGIDHAIRGMRNPLNSWDRSDTNCVYTCAGEKPSLMYCVGDNDLALMTKLSMAGTDHRKFMRMITVYLDVTAPLYWWKEFDTYKVGTVANSCSTMHKIHDKEFVLDDFSYEKLYNDEGLHSSLDVLNVTIATLNKYRTLYNATGDHDHWYQMIQLLPSSYNQKRTIMLNYEVLANIYKSRRNHKLDEWHIFCDWIKTLPHSGLITGSDKEHLETLTKLNDHKICTINQIRKDYGLEPVYGVTSDVMEQDLNQFISSRNTKELAVKIGDKMIPILKL